MVEIVDLPELATRDTADLVLVYDVSASVPKSKKMTVANLLAGVAMAGQDASFGSLSGTSFSTPSATIDNLTVSTGVTLGGTLSAVRALSANVTIPTLAAGAGASVSVTFANAVAGDFVLLNLPASRPDGLIIRGDINASGTLTIRAANATSTSITGATYAITAAILRIA